MTPTDFLRLSDEVAEGLRSRRAVVALESTIIAHGMPYPKNLETALELEALIRAEGATPATVAVMDGKLCVGLGHEGLERLALEPEVLKLSRRDLPYALVQRRLGATTVAATMIAADLAGIRVFATGGIGGVHRGAEATFDISADLAELARTSVAVVCAGAKSILDVGRTLELLETLGVPVLGYQTDAFPAFYSRSSPFGVDYRLDDPEALARFLGAKWALGLRGGAVIANPVPKEDAMPAAEVEATIAQALSEAEQERLRGKAITPYLLARIEALTGGRSLKSNVALARANAQLAARVARALAELA